METIVDYLEEFRDEIGDVDVPDYLKHVLAIRQTRQEGYRFGDAFLGWPVARMSVVNAFPDSICAEYLQYLEKYDLVCDLPKLKQIIGERVVSPSENNDLVIHFRAGDKCSKIANNTLSAIREAIKSKSPDRVVINVVFYLFGQSEQRMTNHHINVLQSIESLKIFVDSLGDVGVPLVIRSHADADEDLCYLIGAKSFITFGGSGYAKLIADIRDGESINLGSQDDETYIETCKRRFCVSNHPGNTKFGDALIVSIPNDREMSNEIANICKHLSTEDGDYGFHQDDGKSRPMPFDGKLFVCSSWSFHQPGILPITNNSFNVQLIINTEPKLWCHNMPTRQLDIEAYGDGDIPTKVSILKGLLEDMYPHISFNSVKAVVKSLKK